MAQTPNFFKSLQVLHKALITGMMLFCAIAIVLMTTGKAPLTLTAYDRTLQVVAVLLGAGLPALGFSLFNKKLQSLANESVATRIAAYRSVTILRWMLIELPAFFATICFLLTGNYAFAALAIALVFVFAVTNPSKTKVVFQLRLNEQEVAELEGAP
jgi:hypothetical protein